MHSLRRQLISQRDVAMIGFVAAIFLFAIVYSVFSSTTIGDSISTGGTLGVTGVSTFTGAVYASSTLQSTGDALFYGNLSAGASTNTPTTVLNITGSGYITSGLGVGYATTGSGNLLVNSLGVVKGRFGVSGTSSPYVELGVSGNVAASSAATTTISAESTGGSIGGCIELKGTTAGASSGTKWVRIYAAGGKTGTSSGTFTVSAGGDTLLVIEAGRCQ